MMQSFKANIFSGKRPLSANVMLLIRLKALLTRISNFEPFTVRIIDETGIVFNIYCGLMWDFISNDCFNFFATYNYLNINLI